MRQPRNALGLPEYRALAEFRYQIRRFLHFSEAAASREGLEPQQHQMMLAIRGLESAEPPTVGQLANHLLIRHHSAVGLIDRLEKRGLAQRERRSADHRQAMVRLTAEGSAVLERLAGAHRAELANLGPHLIEALEQALAAPIREVQHRKEEDVSAIPEDLT